MQNLDRSLVDRVDALLEEHRSRELLSTTGLHGTVDELVLRTRGIERALTELAAQVQKLTDSHES